MTTYALMSPLLGSSSDQLHHSQHRGINSMNEQDSSWYLPTFNESTSWTGQESSSSNYTHTTPSASAVHAQPVWAISQHGGQVDEFDSSSTYEYNTTSTSAPGNAYLTPASSVIDFGHQRSHQSNMHGYLDHHEYMRSMTHSPSMQTCMSTSSDAGSVYADGTPPPAPSAYYQQHADDIAQATILSAIPEKPRVHLQPQPFKSDPKAGNRRRASPPSKSAARTNSGSIDSKETADKVRERRSGHSAVERKYRENLNGKIEVLRQVLIEAHRNYDQSILTSTNMSSLQHRSSDMGMTHTARNSTTTSKEGHPPPDSVITFAATIGSKKSDVLSTAIHYIKEAEQSRSVLLQQVAFLQSQVVKLEGVLCGGAGEYGSVHGAGNDGGSANIGAASQHGNDSSGSSARGSMQQQHHDVKGRMMG